MKIIRACLTICVCVAIFYWLPLCSTETAASIGAANGVMLGSWNTQVEFDNVKIVSGTNVILNGSFADWQREGGDWQIVGGVCRQTSTATPALLTHAFENAATNYTVSVHAKKTSGAEGFLVGFGAQDSENYYWLNLGGWNNTVATVEKSVAGERQPIGRKVDVKIEIGRWYEIKIDVAGPHYPMLS